MERRRRRMYEERQFLVADTEKKNLTMKSYAKSGKKD
jgi:hypothetical protein